MNLTSHTLRTVASLQRGLNTANTSILQSMLGCMEARRDDF